MNDLGFVLIHGAGYGAWLWDRLVPGLAHPAVAVEFPDRGNLDGRIQRLSLDDYVKEAMRQLEGFAPKRWLLVGHSIGGEIALRVASLASERVAGIVFLAATIPPNGQSMISLEPKMKRFFMRFVLKRLPAKPPVKVIRAAVCNDLDDADCREILRKYSPESPFLFLDPVSWSLPAELPRWYVMTLRDRSLPVPLQGTMIARLGLATAVTIDTGHLPMRSKPWKLAALLNDLADQV